MARIGKIARLPRAIREELNVRLQNGEPGHRLVKWLNSLEPVQVVLEAHYAGKPVNEPNLTAWRASGYTAWKGAEEVRTLARELRKDGVGADAGKTVDLAATMMMLKVAELSRLLVDQETDPKKQWKQLCQINLQMSRASRDKSEDVRQRINRERWEREMRNRNPT